MSHDLILQVEKGKISLNPLQKTFQARKKKLESLQKKCVQCVKVMDKHLDFYQKELYPKEKEVVELCKKEIKLLTPYLTDKKNFNKEKRNSIKYVILDLFEQIEHLEGYMQLDDELSQIYETCKGSSFQEEEGVEFEEFKKSLEDFFSKQGNSVDLSSVEMNGSQEEILEKIFESLASQQAFTPPEMETKSSGKSKKQIEKERKAIEKEALQKKAIGVIYKQLAKAFHPDLEQDPVLKLQKQVLMKKLTAAYEAEDLYTILRLEVEHLDMSESQKKNHTDEHLKTYNQILQSQIEMLESELVNIPLKPQYHVLNSYNQYFWEVGDFCLTEVQRTLQKCLKEHRQAIRKLESAHPLPLIYALIKNQEQREDSFL